MKLKYINLQKYLIWLKSMLHVKLEISKMLPKKKVLVLSPHVDDDIIGAGGSLLKHQFNNLTASVVYITLDNKQRLAEAYKAAEMVKYKSQHFIGYTSDCVKPSNFLINKLIEIFELEKPEVILTPFLIDNHRDHLATNKSLVDAVSERRFDFEIFAYEVWTPIYPNFLVDISDVVELKKRCLEIYESQLKDHDYIGQTLALNKFRGATCGFDYAESFFRTSAEYYCYLWRQIYG